MLCSTVLNKYKKVLLELAEPKSEKFTILETILWVSYKSIFIKKLALSNRVRGDNIQLKLLFCMFITSFIVWGR